MATPSIFSSSELIPFFTILDVILNCFLRSRVYLKWLLQIVSFKICLLSQFHPLKKTPAMTPLPLTTPPSTPASVFPAWVPESMPPRALPSPPKPFPLVFWSCFFTANQERKWPLPHFEPKREMCVSGTHTLFYWKEQYVWYKGHSHINAENVKRKSSWELQESQPSCLMCCKNLTLFLTENVKGQARGIMATGKNQGLRVKEKIKSTNLDYSRMPNNSRMHTLYHFVLIIWPRLREVEQLVPGHTTSHWQSLKQIKNKLVRLLPASTKYFSFTPLANTNSGLSVWILATLLFNLPVLRLKH